VKLLNFQQIAIPVRRFAPNMEMSLRNSGNGALNERAKPDGVGSRLKRKQETEQSKVGRKLFSLESAAGLNKGVDGEVQADHSKDCLNRGPLVVSKVVFVVLAYQRRGAKHGKKHKHQAGGLEPECVKGAAHRRDKRFSAGKDRVEQTVFLYNAL
jgi:hypothetical protein